MILRLAILSAFAAGPLVAQDLSFPANATLTAEVVSTDSSYDLPNGAWADDVLPTTRIEGDMTQQAWRIDATGLSSLQLLRPLREQLSNAGYRVSFECETNACGGFDFRFATPVLLPPAMTVNLGDFRFLSATGPDGAVSLLSSVTADAGFVQVTLVGPRETTPQVQADAPRLSTRTVQAQSANLETALEEAGRFVLPGLAFATGSAQLEAGDVPVLDTLAAYLTDNPDRTVALVGHTDSAGSLDGNIALSRRRAGAVLERLVADYGVPRRQLEAQGMGYLAPLASNLTEDGRGLNRRVEVIITSTSE
ncbi:OmpA family protein [Yoonia sp. R2331]|uniref:OmpA family protein n=1 Tax=Yoonia sp. R2331 TaxID=3237238 RepID=UPI0034E5CD77